MDRYKIGSGTLSLIMERYHAGGIPIEELQMMPPKEVELLFYPQKILKRRIFHFQISSTIYTGHKMISKNKKTKKEPISLGNEE